MKKAVILLSGGLDSTTVLAHVIAHGFEPHTLSFDYGQRHQAEIEVARRVASHYGVQDHRLAKIDLRIFGGSALTADIVVPKHNDVGELPSGVPVTYVPARNTIFLSFALAFAETIGSFDIFIGVNALDYSGYPDCRPEYIAAFAQMANLATAAGVEGRNAFTLHTPLINMSKAEIIRYGLTLGVDYGMTLSCYDPLPTGEPCGKCDACLLRAKGFAENHIVDPARI